MQEIGYNNYLETVATIIKIWTVHTVISSQYIKMESKCPAHSFIASRLHVDDV